MFKSNIEIDLAMMNWMNNTNSLSVLVWTWTIGMLIVASY